MSLVRVSEGVYVLEGLGIGRVLFSADAFFPEEVLAKYVAPYHLNVQRLWGPSGDSPTRY